MFHRREKSIVLLHGVVHESFALWLKRKKQKDIFVLEARPYLASAQKTCKILLKHNIKPTLIADNTAGFLFYQKFVKEVWMACRYADGNGAICDIGGLILGVLGKRHKVPVNLFESALSTKLFAQPDEIAYFLNKRVAPRGIKGYVPLVEWVPKKYISRIRK